MNRKSGFSFLETLIVLAVVAVVAALAFPQVSSLVERSRSAACLQNLRAIGSALQTYLGDHAMRMPNLVTGRNSREEDVPVLETVLLPYVANAGVFRCPSGAAIFEKTGSSYFWNSALSGQSALSLNFLGMVEDRSRIPVVFDKEGWHRATKDRVNFLYADGRVAENLVLFTEP